MTLLDEQDLFDEARAAWEDDAELRKRYADIDLPRFNEHAVRVPQKMLDSGRVTIIKSGVTGEKLERFVSLLSDPKGMTTQAEQQGTSNVSATRKSLVQEWCEGALQRNEERSDPPLVRSVREDNGARGQTFVYVGLMPEILAALDGMRTEDGDDDREAQDQYLRENFPIQEKWVPAECVVALRDARGLAEIYVFEDRGVPEILRDYRAPCTREDCPPGCMDEEHTEPLAWKLMQDFQHKRPTMRDRATLCIRADRTHMQIFICNVQVPGQDGSRRASVEQLLWKGEHRMGVVPYQHFRGRTRATTDRLKQPYPFIEQVAGLQRPLDEALTQYHSIGTYTTWPTLQHLRPEGAQLYGPGGEDQPPPVDLPEAGVWVSEPGSRLEPIQFNDPTSMRITEQSVGKITEIINDGTFGKPMYGGTSGNASGYAQNLTQGANLIPLEPFERSESEGWAGVHRLALRAAKVLIDMGIEGIPVLHVGAEGQRYKVLTGEHVGEKGEPFIDWRMTVTVKARQEEQRAAMVQVFQAEKALGLRSDLEREEEYGNRNPEKSRRRRMVEAGMADPENMQTVNMLARGMLLDRIKNETAQAINRGGTLSPGLAQALSMDPSPEAAAWRERMGLAAAPQALGGIPSGLPDAAPPTPTPTDTMMANASGTRNGGPPPGQAQAMPGGAMKVERGLGGLN